MLRCREDSPSGCSWSAHLEFNQARQSRVLEMQKSVFGAVFPVTGVCRSHRHFAKFLDKISAFGKKYTASGASFLISYETRYLRTPGVLFLRK